MPAMSLTTICLHLLHLAGDVRASVAFDPIGLWRAEEGNRICGWRWELEGGQFGLVPYNGRYLLQLLHHFAPLCWSHVAVPYPQVGGHIRDTDEPAFLAYRDARYINRSMFAVQMEAGEGASRNCS